ncbi:MAG: phosphatidate cytidylyltransferase [Bacillaceae bacterium]
MKQRIITGIIAAALFIPIVFYGKLPFFLLTIALATIGLYELLRMKGIKIVSVPSVLIFVVLWVLLLPDESIHVNKMAWMLGIVLLILSYTVISKNKFDFDDVGFLFISVIYVGGGFYYFLQTRMHGVEFIFFALFIIWATDSGAYFVGKAVGKRKLWPEISPNKTIEGSLGGILCAIVVAIVYHFFVSLNVTLPMLIIVTIFASVFGQMGDLVQSAFKRHYGVKDSGNILPGHGGILDRFDSLLFVLPILSIIGFI